METKKAIEYLKMKTSITKEQIKNGELFLYVEEESKEIRAIETVLKELDKQEKIIELTAKYIMYKVPFTKETRCLELKEGARTLNSVKQYFENKANEEVE